MTPDHHIKKYHKLEILAICNKCTDMYGTKCVIADIEGSQEEYMLLPKCMKVRPPSSATHEESSATHEDIGPLRPPQQKKTDIGGSQKQPDIKNSATSATPMREVRPPLYDGGAIPLTELDKEIIELAANHNHCRAISIALNRARSTVQYRLNRMEKAGLIASNKGVNGTKIYKISAKVRPPLIHNETSPVAMTFTAHSMSFKFPILEGKQPKSSKAYKVNNWTGYVHDSDPDFVIRATPKSIIIDIREDLGAGSVDDLNMKYSQIAQSKAYNFATKKGIVLGGISKTRSGHFTIENSALGQIVAERGEFRTKSGIMIDKSKSKGDLEMEEKSAKAMEYTLTKLPVIAAGIQDNTYTIQTKLSDISEGIEDIQKWLVLERENRQLLNQNKILEESLERIAKEVDEIKTQIPEPDHKDKLKPGEMYG